MRRRSSIKQAGSADLPNEKAFPIAYFLAFVLLIPVKRSWFESIASKKISLQ